MILPACYDQYCTYVLQLVNYFYFEVTLVVGTHYSNTNL